MIWYLKYSICIGFLWLSQLTTNLVLKQQTFILSLFWRPEVQPKSRCQQGHGLTEGSKEEPFLTFSQWPQAFFGLQLSCVTQSLPTSAFFSIAVCIFLSLTKKFLLDLGPTLVLHEVISTVTFSVSSEALFPNRRSKFYIFPTSSVQVDMRQGVGAHCSTNYGI